MTQKATSKINFRCSPMQHSELKKLAKRHELTTTNYILTRTLTPQKLKTRDEKQQLTDAIFELKRAGINVNQIAHAINLLLIGKKNIPVNSISSNKIFETLEKLNAAVRKIEEQF
jgi:hypothetical protein